MGRPLLLVGDNPFLGVSHVTQERARERAGIAGRPEAAASILLAAIESGADGFMFSLTDSTLAILRSLAGQRPRGTVRLLPLIPYAYEWVRWTAGDGGILAIGRRHVRDLLRSRDPSALWAGFSGLVRGDPSELLNSYLAVQLAKLRAVPGAGRIEAVLLHEVLTDVAIALDLGPLAARFADFVRGQGLVPGLETRNFAHLVRRLREWGLDREDLRIAAPFNRIGFQMCPDREACEAALAALTGDRLLAMSIFAGGYLPPREAIGYVRRLPNLAGVVAGVSSVDQARETFRLLREGLGP